MWECLREGEGVLLELPSRWYAGVVLRRTSTTVMLGPDLALCGHDLGDLGLFLEGRVSETTEVTPLPRGVELSLSSVDSAQPYPAELLRKVCRRTHSPQPEKDAGE